MRVRFIEFFLKKADAIIVYSQNGKAYLSKKGISEKKIFVAPNTINTKKLIAINSNLNKHELRKKYSLSDDDFIVIFSGRLYADKKVKNLLKAVKKINIDGLVKSREL